MRAVTFVAILLSGVAGCQSTPRESLTAPRTLTSPYDQNGGEVLWAVAPIRNESGVTHADDLDFADKIAAAAEQAQGVRVVPVNRTLEAMRSLDMRGVRTPADARKLAQTMGVDAVLVGSLTSFDPYTPALGLSIALIPRPGAMVGPRTALSPRELATAPTDAAPAPRPYEDTPLATASMHLDGKNNQVQMDIRAYAEGRLDGPSALGWRRYLASADLFAEFAAFEAIDDLLRQEWLRLARTSAAAGSAGGGR